MHLKPPTSCEIKFTTGSEAALISGKEIQSM